LLGGQEAKILYCPVFGESLEPVELPVIPRHLLFYRTNWYLLAQYRDKVRTYSLSRIKEVIPGEKTSVTFDSQALIKQIEHTYGIFVTDEANPILEIRLRFSPVMTHYIETISFHPDQTSKRLEDGGLELSFPSTLNRELISEVLRYIDEVEIVSPDCLRLEVRKILEKGMRNLV
jgi:predicted DNA-binding transcriptional regulator YafY